eukprot:scaffold8417_cov83-Skeletonema_dohrnii-CCMP3373.AAC.2
MSSVGECATGNSAFGSELEMTNATQNLPNQWLLERCRKWPFVPLFKRGEERLWRASFWKERVSVKFFNIAVLNM